jgi:hypothetical protein
MKDLIKAVKKLSPKKGEILVIHTEYRIDDIGMQAIKDVLSAALEKNGFDCMLLHSWGSKDKIRFEELTQGRHKVYLNNLEYLELLEKRKGLTND